jgi:hypothetical protein
MVIEAGLAVASIFTESKLLAVAGAANASTHLIMRLKPDGKFIEARDEMFRDWVSELAQRLAAIEQRFDTKEQGEYSRRTVDNEFVAVTANYFRDAHVEPLNERKLMLAVAAASIANLSLSVAELARIQRTIRELDPNDVLELYGLWLVPTSVPDASHLPENKRARFTAGALRFQRWQVGRAEALETSGCVVVRTGGGPTTIGDSEPSHELQVTLTGLLVLTALRPYIALREPDVRNVPGHDVIDNFRSKSEAEKAIATVPNLRSLLTAARSGMLGKLQYDGAKVVNGTPHNSTAKLIFDLQDRYADRLPPSTTTLPTGKTLDELVVVHRPVTEGWIHVQVWGPHDVLRFLAYEFDATWA